MTPFDYLNTINDTKQDIMETEEDERSYVPFVINRSLSYFADTVGLANVVNQHHHIDKKLQYRRNYYDQPHSQGRWLCLK